MRRFADFAATCKRLQGTTKKLEKLNILSAFLESLGPDEIEVACRFFLGKTFPDFDARTLSVSWRTLQRVLAQIEPAIVGSVGPSLLHVHKELVEISEISGVGSRKRIDKLLTDLFTTLDSLSREYLSKIIFGEMRIGVAEGVLLEGIARMAAVPANIIRRANMYLGDPGEVARLALTSGKDALEKVAPEIFRPVQPMLAALAEDISEVLTIHEHRTALEFKLDGARVQVHKRGEEVRIFSRHLTDVTASLPDLVLLVQASLEEDDFIVEGEVLAVGSNGRPLPFQELMRRFRRVHGIEQLQQEVPLKLYLFDLLYLRGTSYIDEPYEKRISLLQQVAGQELLVERIVTKDVATGDSFLQKALDAGHEGLMAKQLDSVYTPGTRGKRWFKIKPAETLDLVVIAADWGSGRRVGWLSNYHLAARDPGTGELLMLGKTFKGLTDDQFRWMTDKLQQLKLRESDYTVFVRPELVVEVAFNEIQRSPHYNSNFALRFARIKRIREDKSAAQADTSERVRELFEKQFQRKARKG